MPINDNDDHTMAGGSHWFALVNICWYMSHALAGVCWFIIGRSSGLSTMIRWGRVISTRRAA